MPSRGYPLRARRKAKTLSHHGKIATLTRAMPSKACQGLASGIEGKRPSLAF
jgi:hypothetical protein